MWKIWWKVEHVNEKYKFIDLSPCEQYLSPIQDEHPDSWHGQQLWRNKVKVRGWMKSDLCWWRNTMNENLSWIIFHLWTSVVLPASGLMSVTVRKTGYESVPEHKLGRLANWASLTEAQNRKGVYRIAGWLSIISTITELPQSSQDAHYWWKKNPAESHFFIFFITL